MSIIGYSEASNEVFYTVLSKGSEVVEDMPAKQLLATRPVLVEVYEYRNDVTLETRVERRIQKCEQFPKNMQLMIIDYFEVGLVINVGMQLIENILALGKKPPFPMILTLVNTMLNPKDKFTKKSQQKDHWQHCKRAHAILLDILSLYGPEIFHSLWNQFKFFKLVSDRKANTEVDDAYSELDTKRLTNYSDIWNFTDQLLNHGTKNLDSKCRRLVLDFFVNILQTDLKAKLDDETNMKKSIFYKTIKTKNMKTYINILFNSFPHPDENLLYLAGDILNMFITVSCYETTDIVNLVYQKFRDMDGESCQQLMQLIKYPTFLLEICDKALADVDISNVDSRYRLFCTKSHIPLHLEKVLFYVFRTVPIADTLEAIYRHVSIVSKYCMCVFSTASISHKRASTETNSAFAEEQLLLLITHQHEALNGWEEIMEKMMLTHNSIEDLEIIEKIRWTIKLTRLTVTEYI
ncbi:unnamed protein product [Mucor hiemalis]